VIEPAPDTVSISGRKASDGRLLTAWWKSRRLKFPTGRYAIINYITSRITLNQSLLQIKIQTRLVHFEFINLITNCKKKFRTEILPHRKKINDSLQHNTNRSYHWE